MMEGILDAVNKGVNLKSFRVGQMVTFELSGKRGRIIKDYNGREFLVRFADGHEERIPEGFLD